MQGAASALESLGRSIGPVWGNGVLQLVGAGAAFGSGALVLASLAPLHGRPQGIRRGCELARGGVSVSVLPAAELDQLHLVAVRVLDERDRRAAVLHGARLTRHLRALRAQSLDRLVNPLDAERDVAIRGAEIVRVRVPVVGELEDRLPVSGP